MLDIHFLYFNVFCISISGNLSASSSNSNKDDSHNSSTSSPSTKKTSPGISTTSTEAFSDDSVLAVVLAICFVVIFVLVLALYLLRCRSGGAQGGAERGSGAYREHRSGGTDNLSDNSCLQYPGGAHSNSSNEVGEKFSYVQCVWCVK